MPGMSGKNKNKNQSYKILSYIPSEKAYARYSTQYFKSESTYINTLWLIYNWGFSSEINK